MLVTRPGVQVYTGNKRHKGKPVTTGVFFRKVLNRNLIVTSVILNLFSLYCKTRFNYINE